MGDRKERIVILEVERVEVLIVMKKVVLAEPKSRDVTTWGAESKLSEYCNGKEYKFKYLAVFLAMEKEDFRENTNKEIITIR